MAMPVGKRGGAGPRHDAQVSTAFPVILGAVLAVLGFLCMWFRVPVAAFFREAQEWQGSRSAASQTPALAFLVGAFFFAAGLFVAVGTLAGWIHPK
jgi:uncharacterized membrane protein